MKVELSEEARAQVKEIDAWWRENRLAVPDLFTHELDQAVGLLEQSPKVSSGPRPRSRRQPLRGGRVEQPLPGRSVRNR